ncbi:MAG: hypothetical protein K2N82_03445, partial [Lachnospiraceae bacterium]|nr:hypothetical protein [Lachnospiraceae bacterium]
MKMKRRILLVGVLMLMLAGCASASRQQAADSQERKEQLNKQEDDLQSPTEKPADENFSLDSSSKKGGESLQEVGNEDVDSIPGVPEEEILFLKDQQKGLFHYERLSEEEQTVYVEI